MAIGRISGPLLKANLVRDGVDLAFETDLLYLDVNNSRIGINSAAPQYALDVVGTTRTTNLRVDNQFDIGNLTVNGNTLSSTLNTITLQPSGSEPVIYHSRLQVDDLDFQNNTISTLSSNVDLEIRTSGTGDLDIYADTNIDGNLFVSGNIQAGGNLTIGGDITIGDSPTDSVVINAKINSDLIPETDNTYSLGNSTFRWASLTTNNLFATTLNLQTLTVANISLSNSTITTTGNNDLILDPNGTGVIRTGNFTISTNTIRNTATGAITLLQASGTGYFKITGTNAFVPPKGNSSQRPTLYAEEGMTRYNTDSKALEIWNGTQWASPAGTSGAVSEAQAEDIAARFSIIL
jgi:hypothetical protein